MKEAVASGVIVRARSGDESAIERLLVDCYERLRYHVSPRMDPHLKERFETEDVIQEVYVAAWRAIAEAEFENPAAFWGWVRTIAENKLNDLRDHVVAAKRDMRREVGKPPGRDSSYASIFDRLAKTQTTPSSAAARREAVALLLVRLARLPEDRRLVIQLRLIQGRPAGEVARVLGRPSEAAVHMLLHRALKDLAELMGRSSRYFSSS